MFNLKDVTVVVFSRDHVKFVDECFKSIEREFKGKVKLINVDVGSLDGTPSRIINIGKELGLSLSQIIRPRSLKTLQVLKSLDNDIQTRFIVLISADDVFGEDYGKSLRGALAYMETESVLNFRLIETDVNLEPIKSRNPKWQTSYRKNQRMLSYKNPGTTPGSLIPYEKLKTLKDWKTVPSILIEDYWLWWTLIEHVPFVNVIEGTVYYRRHEESISASVTDPEYAFSLGYVTALPQRTKNSIFNKMISTSLILRWGRHLKSTTWISFLSGFRLGYREVI